MSRGDYDVLAIGGSAGSLPVMCRLLEAVDPDTAMAFVICLHTGTRDAHDLCDVFSRYSPLPVVEAEEGAPVKPACVHVAVGGYHLLVERAHTFALCAGERVQYARPSIDVLFESMAEAYQRRLIGMLLSGANADGSAGLHAIQRLGGFTLVQRPDTALVADMPEAALALFTPDRQNSPEELIEAVRELSRRAR